MENVAAIRMLHDCTVENAMTPAQHYVYTNDDFQRPQRKQNSIKLFHNIFSSLSSPICLTTRSYER